MGTEQQDEASILLQSATLGSRLDAERLFTLVYEDLKRMAGGFMRRESVDHTLTPTALVHESYVRLLAGDGRALSERAHFMGVAARAMRQILIDHARGKRRLKRGGGRSREPLDDVLEVYQDRGIDLLDLDEALKELEAADPQTARIFELRVFAELGMGEIAELVSLPMRTVDRRWAFGKSWLRGRLGTQGAG